MMLLAALLLSPLFSDHAVLQRGRPVAVWGRAAPGEKVKVRHAGRIAAGQADASGDWIAFLPPADSGSGDLVIQGKSESLVRHDVVSGEVWIAAGDPQLTFPAGGPSPQATSAPDAGEPAPVPRVRIFREGAWYGSENGPADGFREVAGRFAADLAGRLDCPIGVVQALRPATLTQWLSPMAAGRPGLAGPAPSPASQAYLAELDPLAPLTAAGAVWCGDSADRELGTRYHDVFMRFVTSWRAHLGAAEFPVFWVQLPAADARGPDTQEASDATLRWEQTRCLALAHTGQAITYDLAGAAEAEAGRRLALLAKREVYSIPEDTSGPVVAGMDVLRGAVRVRFRYADNGLIAAGRPPQGFEVAGRDGRFHPATAILSGSTALVRSPQVPQPVAVRYGWRTALQPNLFNGAGLPAGPFTSE